MCPVKNPTAACQGPNDIHVVGKNASRTKPAKLLAILVKDKSAPALVAVKA